MGCESLAERERTPRDQRFQTLIALMLSSQTKDTVLAPVMRGMQEKMPGVGQAHSTIYSQLTKTRASTLNPFLHSNRRH